MWSDNGTITFSTPEPYANALRSVREALQGRGLRVVSELDVAGRIERSLGIRLPPCRILYVWPHPPLAEDLSPIAAIILPFHVVVADRGEQAEISVLTCIQTAGLNGCLRTKLLETQTEILQSLETVSMRPSLV